MHTFYSLHAAPWVQHFVLKYIIEKGKIKEIFPSAYHEVTWKSEGKAPSINFGVSRNWLVNACLGRLPPRQKSRVVGWTSHIPSLEAAERSKFLAPPRSKVTAPRMSSLQPSRDTKYAVLDPLYM